MCSQPTASMMNAEFSSGRKLPHKRSVYRTRAAPGCELWLSHEVNGVQPLSSSLMNSLTQALSPYLGGNQWCKVNGWNNIDEKLICYVNIEGRTKKMIKCADCDYTTNAPSHYFRHEIKHSKIKPFSCPLCSLTFQRRYKIKYHVIKEHPGEDIENLYY